MLFRLVLCLVIFPGVGIASDEIDKLVKQAIQDHKNPDCLCGPDCDCDGCKCKPGFKCDSNGCKRLKATVKESLVPPCRVCIDDRVIYSLDGYTPSEAMAAIKAQGSKVVFLNSQNVIIETPSWYTGALPATRQSPGGAGGLPFTTWGTTAPPAVGYSTWSSGTYQMAPIAIGAPPVGRFGGTLGKG